MVAVFIGWSPNNAADQSPKHTLRRSKQSYPLLRVSLLSLETVFLGQRAVTLLYFKISFDVVKNIPGMNKALIFTELPLYFHSLGNPLCVGGGRA